MPFLLRVQLPDVPGSLGRLATTIGEVGGDIAAIEIVEKRFDGTAVDDVMLDTEDGVMPDSIVSACNALDGVEVMWISRYVAGGLVLDLEAVEALASSPAEALDRLVSLVPDTFRVDWAVRVHRAQGVLGATAAAPGDIDFIELERPERLEADGEDADTLLAAARIDGNEIIVVARRGGPEFLDSELARLGHLCALAASIAASA